CGGGAGGAGGGVAGWGRAGQAGGYGSSPPRGGGGGGGGRGGGGGTSVCLVGMRSAQTPPPPDPSPPRFAWGEGNPATLLAATVIYFIAFLVLAWPWLSGAVTIPWDAKAQFQPELQFLARSLHEGRPPLWP